MQTCRFADLSNIPLLFVGIGCDVIQKHFSCVDNRSVSLQVCMCQTRPSSRVQRASSSLEILKFVFETCSTLSWGKSLMYMRLTPKSLMEGRCL